MGILSSSASITRYLVQGQIEKPVMETVLAGLKKNTIRDIDGETEKKAVGWTSFSKPFTPDFEGSSFVVGTYFIFSLRVDKKSLPSKVLRKLTQVEIARRLAETKREFLSREEKQDAREHVENMLARRIPATPSIHDVVWSHEENSLWLFSTQKAAREELETLFHKSFGVLLVPLYPYTAAELTLGLTEDQCNRLAALMPSAIVE